MSRYALTSTGELIVCWPTSAADGAVVLTHLPDRADERAATLAAALTGLSAQLWRTYTHPASAVPDDGDNSEHWRREQAHASVDAVLDSLSTPNAPDENGNLLASYDPVEEAANRVGRALLAFDDAVVSQRVRDDVAIEIAALQRAERGDLDDRAAQAVSLSRPQASPVQIAEAHQALARQPLGGADLFQNFEPSAASVAAAHWLHAAARLAAEECGYDDLATVIRGADDIEALPTRTLIVVVNRMAEGQSAHSIVVELIREAQGAADGFIGDPAQVLAQIEQAIADADRWARSGAELDKVREALLGEVRVCLLDPARPGRNLLEDLMAGIYGCWLMYAEASDLDEDDVEDQFVTSLRDAAAETLPD
jgi:hypothetical protein